MTQRSDDPRDLISAATPLPWIRPWEQLTVRAPGNGDLFGRLVPSIHHPGSRRAQANIDLAVYSVNNLPALLDVADAARDLVKAVDDGSDCYEARDEVEGLRAALARLRENQP